MESNFRFTGVLDDDVDAIASTSNLEDLIKMLRADGQLRFLISKVFMSFFPSYFIILAAGQREIDPFS
jgi:hypothetical protein